MASLLRKSLPAIAALLFFHTVPANAAPPMDWQPPAFQLNDSGGQALNFPEDLDGSSIVLFWASWCPYCKALMPHLQSIVDEYDGEIQVLALNFRDDDDPAEYIDDRGYDFRLFPDSDSVAELWGVKTTPGLFLADGNGRVVFSNFSIPDTEHPPEDMENMKHYQKAARKAPLWAARLRLAIDELAASGGEEH